jgi:CoA:oxalate CoA-transferase
MQRPLEGIRVIDVSRVVSGPLCGRLLADLGADVVKVEAPEGDITRSAEPEVNGLAPYYAQMNSGKRALCLDLKRPEAVDALLRLLDQADVLVENFRPGVLSRLGLAVETLQVRNPRLIVCSITGWGQTGPWSQLQAYAPRVHAQGGLLEMISRFRRRPAEQETQIHADVYAAVLAAGAVSTALFHRERSGVGQHLDVAMGEALLYVNEWAAVELQRHPGHDREQPTDDHGRFDIWKQPVFPLANGTQVALVGRAITMLPLIVGALNAGPGALEDPRYGLDSSSVVRDTYARGVIAGLLLKIPDMPALDEAFKREPGVMFSELRSVADLAASDWARDRGLTTEVAAGVSVPTAPWRSDRAAVGVAGPPPRQGEHSREVLTEAGLSPHQIDGLFDSGAAVGLAQDPGPADA